MDKIILKHRPDLWVKVCNCGNITQYKTYGSYTANKHRNSPCKECRYKSHSKKLSGRKRNVFSDKWRKNMAIAHKNSAVWKQSMNTTEYKEIHRQKMLRIIKENKLSVAYNQKACEVFNYLNKKLNWNGLHAKNGKEQVINVFYLDYYEPTLNLTIEWDEKHHKKAKQKQRDGFKQKIITEQINCEFYRVDDITKLVKKVDHNSIDRTHKLQQVINEYYEN